MSACPDCGALPLSTPTAGHDLGEALKSLWGRADPDLRLCPRCGDWFIWSTGAAPQLQKLTRLERPAALVMEELLSGTTRPHEVIDQAMALVDAPVFAAVVDHLSDDGLAPVLERLVGLLTTSGDVGTAVMQRLEVAARSSRFAGPLMTLLTAAPASKRTLRLLAVCEGAPGPKPLPADELADFWALGISLEAEWVSDDEWRRAIRETRAQEVSSYSSMGTAETGWVRCTTERTPRAECAVVPPGGTAEHTEWGDLRDDRDTTAVCWQPFWNGQVASALRHVTGPAQRYLLAECARHLKALEHEVAEGTTQQKLVGWLDEVTLAPEVLERELLAVKERSLVHLVRGVRARWLKPDCSAAVDAVLLSAERGPRDFWGHGDTRAEAAVRMELLRFIVRLVRH